MDLLAFAEEVLSFHCPYYMTSFNTGFLFTNIPLEETIKLFDKLFDNKTEVIYLIKEFFQSLLELATLDFFGPIAVARRIL